MSEDTTDVAVKTGAELTQLTEQQRLINGINDWLESDHALEAQYVGTDGKDVHSRFVVVESLNGLTQVALRRISGVQGTSTEAITVRWFNEKQRRAGHILYSGGPNSTILHYDAAEHDVDENYAEFWKRQGGMSKVEGTREKVDFSRERIGQLATLLEKGHVSEDMTEAAAKYFETEMGGITLRQNHTVSRPKQEPRRVTATVTKAIGN